MMENIRHVFLITTAVISIFMIIAGWKYLSGYLLGTAVSYLAFLNTVHYVDETLRIRIPAGMGHRVFNYMMWTAVLVICALLPDYLNILACALGLFMIRISIIVSSLIEKKR